MPELGGAFSATREEQARLLALTAELAPAVLRGQTMIELPENAQVASVPAGNYDPEEPPVEELSHTVTLSLTVPQHALPATVSRLSATLAAAVQESQDAEDVTAASLSVYPVTPDSEEE